MRTIGVMLLALGFLFLTVGCKRKKPTTTEPVPGAPVPGASRATTQPTANKGLGTFTVGKSTTYVTAPLDGTGHIDYATALNERMSKGVTPQNNANVLIWQAIGPTPYGTKPPPDYFAKLGMAAPPATGEYFVGIRAHFGAGTEAAVNNLVPLTRRPWTAAEQPQFASWLKANETPLGLVAAATARSHFYSPLVPSRTDQGSSGLISSLLPGAQASREIASAIAARAMRSIGQGQVDAAWQDLLTCHRLGRFVSRGGTLIEELVGFAIELVACRADIAFLAHTRPDAKRLEGYIRDLKSLPGFPGVAEKVDIAERFTMLEHVMLLDQQGIGYLQRMGKDSNVPAGPSPFGEEALNGINWGPALENANKWYDRLAGALREKERPDRVRKMEQFTTDLLVLKAKASDPARLSRLLAEGADPGKAKGEAVGDILISLLMPAAQKVQDSADRVTQTFDNTVLAFTLALYHAENGRYPNTLDALVPKYRDQAPTDLFTGNALIYRPAPNGYILYSVGANGTDDGGRGQDDQPPGDDLVVRMPHQ